MENNQSLNRMHETMAWGAIVVWWGSAVLLRLPNGMDALGIGVILLGLVGVRSRMGLASSGVTITLGIVALVWGLLDLSRSVLHLPLELGGEFAILIIVLGLALLAVALTRSRTGIQTGEA
ncbi:MAG: hypothetical protein M1570_04225 [Chloroflexi bacterium]|nr:hypothetical protein [Chloroflexota bacterium]